MHNVAGTAKTEGHFYLVSLMPLLSLQRVSYSQNTDESLNKREPHDPKYLASHKRSDDYRSEHR